MLTTIDKARVSEDAVQQITSLIRSGAYSPGDKLPSERQLTHQLGVSRTSVREALRKLETMGLVEIRQGLGIFIKDPGSQVVQATVLHRLLLEPLTLRKLFELREIVEVEAAGRAALRATPEQMEDMRRWAEAMETAFTRDDVNSMVMADLAFHRQIIVATHNDILVDLVDGLGDMLRDMRRASLSIRDSLTDTIAGHRAILAAIEARDSDGARRAMAEHLHRVQAKVDSFGPKAGSPPALPPDGH